MTVVYDKSAALAGTDDGDGDSNLNHRQIIRAANLSAATGTQARITVLFGTACPTETASIDDCYIGRAAISGHAYDFNGNQVKVTFGGSGSINGAAASSQTSDWVTFGGGESYDNTKDLVVSIHCKSGSAASISTALGVTNTDQAYDFGATNAGTSVVTLGTSDAATAVFTTIVEIQAVASAVIPNKIYQTNFAVKRAAYY